MPPFLNETVCQEIGAHFARTLVPSSSQSVPMALMGAIAFAVLVPSSLSALLERSSFPLVRFGGTLTAMSQSAMKKYDSLVKHASNLEEQGPDQEITMARSMSFRGAQAAGAFMAVVGGGVALGSTGLQQVTAEEALPMGYFEAKAAEVYYDSDDSMVIASTE